MSAAAMQAVLMLSWTNAVKYDVEDLFRCLCDTGLAGNSWNKNMVSIRSVNPSCFFIKLTSARAEQALLGAAAAADPAYKITVSTMMEFARARPLVSNQTSVVEASSEKATAAPVATFRPKMCRYILAGRECHVKDCGYVHDEDKLIVCRYGSNCRYGSTCNFHHPKETPTPIAAAAAPRKVMITSETIQVSFLADKQEKNREGKTQESPPTWNTHEEVAQLLHAYISVQELQRLGHTQMGSFYSHFGIDKDMLPKYLIFV